MDSVQVLISDFLHHVNLMTIIFSVATLTGLCLYSYYRRKYSFWSNQGITGPKPIPVLGNSLDLFLKPILKTDPENIKKYGRVYGMYQGTNPMLVISDPEIIKDVMVKEFNTFPNRMNVKSSHVITNLFLPQVNGDEWKRQRTIMSPTFSSGKMRYMYDIMSSCVDSLESALKKKAQSNDYVNIKHTMGCYTMDVIAKCCFATDTNCHEDPDNVFMQNASIFFTFDPFKLVLSLFTPAVLRQKLGLTPNSHRVLEFFIQVSRELIKKRRSESTAVSDKRAKDFLDIMLEAGKDVTGVTDSEDKSGSKSDIELHHVNEDQRDGNTSQSIKTDMLNLKNVKKNLLTDDEITANSILFFAAGYETTGSLLTYSSYCLAMFPKVQEKLHQEIIKWFPDGSKFDYDVVSKMEYLDAFISEVLRYYTPVIRHQRTSVADYHMVLNGDKKIFVPKGSVIIIPADAIHRDPEFYEDPNDFNPDRFLPENRSKLVPYTYLPFGSGPRNCIGMRFALLEAKLALARVISKFKFIRSDQTEDPIEFSAMIFLRQSKSVTLKVEER